MSTPRPTGGPAFPTPHTAMNSRDGYASFDGGTEGLTLRDWFAGQAMGALTARVADPTPEKLARAAYTLADAMLAERERAP